MLAPGTEVGGYRIEGLLGRGGMGVVYEATQLSLGRRVALKLLANDLSVDPSFRDRFRREGRIQAGIDHAHIVPIYEAGELPEHGLFIAMRLVRGPNLKELVQAGELDARRALRILRLVADALDTAHEADLVHRDIKPQNILVGRRDHAYLADFGLTRAPGDTAHTKTGQFVGTLDYVSPEQIRGEPPTAQSDLYSFAAVAYEVLTGAPPFARPSEAAILFAHISDPPPSARARRPELPPGVDDVIAAGLAKLPGERPDSVSDFVERLDAALAAVPDLAPAPPPAPEPAPAPRTPEVATRRPAPVEAATVVPSPGRVAAAAADTAVTARAASGARTAPVEPAPVPEPAPGPAAGAGEVTEQHSRIGAPTRADQRRPWAGAAPPAAPAPPEAAAVVPPEPEPEPELAPEPQLAPRREPAPAGAPAARRRTPVAALGAVVVVALAVVLGVLAGGSGGSGGGGGGAAADPTPARVRATAGPLVFRGPPGWTAARTPALGGLELRDAATLGRGGGAMVVGRTDATGATMLPPAFLARLDAPPATDDAVAVGRAQAFRYADLAPEGAEPMTVLVAPSTDGVLTVACLGSAAERAQCVGAATSLGVEGGDLRFEAVGPSRRYATTLAALVTTLGRSRAAALGRARSARTAAGQRRALEDAAAAYRVARRTLAGLAPNVPETTAHAAVGAALDRARGAYAAAATAARRERRGAYDAARDRARAADRAVGRALAAHEALGYRVA